MCLIPLTKGKSAIVDSDMYEYLNQWKWYALKQKNGYYAYRTVHLGIVDGKIKNKMIAMHRLILGAKKGQLSDHRNRNTLDNRRNNLRLCNSAQNCQNKEPRKNCTSKYKGVHWNKLNENWRAMIRLGKQKHIGCFESEVDAAKAYDVKAKEMFGEFAYLNFMKG